MLLWQGGPPRAAKPRNQKGCVACEPGLSTPAELADAAGVTRATMTGLVDTLERDGFVKREPDPIDRRQMSVRLTPRGEKFLDAFLPGHFKAIAALMSPLNETERKTLVRLLNKIQQQAAALDPRREATPPVPAR